MDLCDNPELVGLPEVLRWLPKGGVYVMGPDADIGSDAASQELLRASWKH